MSDFLREILDVAKAVISIAIVAGVITYFVTAAACIAINTWRGR